MAGFERSTLTRALERRAVVRGSLMRGTIHIVSRRDYWLLAEAIRQDRRSWWLGVTPHQISEAQVAAAAGRLRAMLADGPRRLAGLMAELGVDPTTWNGVGGWVDLLRVPPLGTWEQRRADLYAAAEDWLGASDATFDHGIELLVGRYLGGFGPASSKDIASWAGIGVPTLAPVLERMRLRRFHDDRDEELVDLPRAPLPDASAPSPVRFLPTWDATLLMHARRTQILPEEYRSSLFDVKTPHSVLTLLVDGTRCGDVEARRGAGARDAVRARATPREAGTGRRDRATEGLAGLTRAPGAPAGGRASVADAQHS